MVKESDIRKMTEDEIIKGLKTIQRYCKEQLEKNNWVCDGCPFYYNKWDECYLTRDLPADWCIDKFLQYINRGRNDN